MIAKEIALDDQRNSDGGTSDIRELMGEVMQQISDTEQRNSALLKQMHQRLAALDQDTRTARARLPEAAQPGPAMVPASDDPFAIDGLLSSAAPVAPHVYIPPFSADAAQPHAGVEPQPLRSAAGHHRPLNTSYPNVDPFDVVESLPGNPSEPWSSEGAAALTELYASGEATLAPGLSDDFAATLVTAQKLPAAPLAAQASAPAAAADMHAGPVHKEWLEDRLGDLTSRIERALSQGGPDSALAQLGHRIEALEQRIADAMAAEAQGHQPGPDAYAVQQIESQIHLLGHEFDAVRAELDRLRTIEQQLGEVMHQLGGLPDRSGASHLHAQPARDETEMQTIAVAAAEAAVARMVHEGHGFAAADAAESGTAGRIESLHALLAGYIDGRRVGDEQNAQAMDALQQAMLRVLDRLDALEGVAPASEDDAYLAAGSYRPAFEDEIAPASIPAPPAPAKAAPAPAPAAMRPAPETTHSDDLADGSDHSLEDAAPREDELPSDPIARQRVLLQASARRAAIAQREKQKAEAAAPKSIVAKLAGAIAPKGSAKPGSGKVMVSGLALAAALGFGAMLVMTNMRPEESPAADAGQTSAPAASQTAGTGADPVQPQAVAGQADEGRGKPAEPARAAAAKPDVLSPNLMPETVTELDGSAVEAETTQTANSSRIVGGDGPRAQFANATTTNAPLSGILFQASADTGALDPLPSQGPGLPINGSVRAQAGGPGAGAASGSLALPPATVGPLSMRIAAAKGDPSAEFEVGSRLAEGKGTDQDLKEAATWYQRAASQGLAAAQYRLATLFERGLGVKADMARAKSWYQRAAEQGNVKSMHNLAVLAAGRGGSNPDYATAVAWFTQAANHGLADSQFNLGVLTESGLGVQKDRVQAAMWFILAAQAGDREAIRRRDQMKARMDRSEWAAADHLARSWQPMAPDKLANDARYAGELWKSRQAQASTDE